MKLVLAMRVTLGSKYNFGVSFGSPIISPNKR
jgi:hypothetical protein